MQEFKGKTVIIAYDEAKCVHAGECVKSLPAVFDPGRTPWIDPDRATESDAAVAVAACPSGALSLKPMD